MMYGNSPYARKGSPVSRPRKLPRMLPRVLCVVCLYCMLCFGMLLAAGCSYLPVAERQEPLVPVTAPYNEVCLQHYQLAQHYAIAGRYELAREYYLLALASAENQRLRGILASELDGVEKMIYSTR